MGEAIGLAFKGEDPDLVEIVEAVGDVAIASHSGKLGAKEKEEQEWYIGLLVKRYFSFYDSRTPERSLFAEAINWYVKKTFGEGNFKLAKQVKGIMRDILFKPYEKYRMEHYQGTMKPAFSR